MDRRRCSFDGDDDRSYSKDNIEYTWDYILTNLTEINTSN